jgi:hypothetical protein
MKLIPTICSQSKVLHTRERKLTASIFPEVPQQQGCLSQNQQKKKKKKKKKKKPKYKE